MRPHARVYAARAVTETLAGVRAGVRAGKYISISWREACGKWMFSLSVVDWMLCACLARTSLCHVLRLRATARTTVEMSTIDVCPTTNLRSASINVQCSLLASGSFVSA
jgi:hypothetical protein